MILGTTEEMITASMSSSCNFVISNSSLMHKPNSSDVLGVFVVKRKEPMTSLPCINPREIFVFPTSIVIRIFMLFSPLDMF